MYVAKASDDHTRDFVLMRDTWVRLGGHLCSSAGMLLYVLLFGFVFSFLVPRNRAAPFRQEWLRPHSQQTNSNVLSCEDL